MAPRDGMLLGQMEKGADGDRTVALSQTGGVLAVCLLPVILGREGGNLMEERAAVLPKRVGQREADMEPVVVGSREVHVGGLQGLNKGLDTCGIVFA